MWIRGAHWTSVQKVKVAQSCLTLCDPMDYTVHGILQASILEWVAILFFKGSSKPRVRTQVPCIADGFFTSWVTREAIFVESPSKPRIVVAHLWLTLCNPMNCSMPGFPVLHHLPEFVQNHVHWVGGAIQSSHPLSPPSPPALNLSQHQDLF